jgi:GxxExxY protein
MKSEEELNEISGAVIGKAIDVHKALGAGLLESTYQKCLVYELTKCGFQVESEKAISIRYKELIVETAYRIDILVNDSVVVELKAVDKIIDVHKAQVLTYLKHGNYKVGLLLNFNVLLLKNGGITRIVN